MEWTKYVMSLTLGGGLLLLFGKKGHKRNKWLLGAGAGIGLAAMDLVVQYIWNRELWEMAVSVLRGMAFFSFLVLLGYGKEWLAARGQVPDEKEAVHPVRQWMQDYQESFAQLSRSFCMVPSPVQGLDRADRIWQSRLAESRMAAAGQLQEMGNILEGAMERIYGTREDAGLEQEIGSRLRLMGILVQRVFLYGVKGKRRQLYITMRTRKKACVPVKKIAQVLSEVTECEMMPARDSRSFVTQDRTTVLFVEGMAYNALYGVKKATRKDEAVSGDNFSVFWLPDGYFYAGVSDGMGSGLQACTQSELVLDLMEQFLEAGFSKETAVRMINSSIVLQPDSPVFSTVDLVSVDLYTGVCEFLKIGAAASFMRRENKVECIRGTGLPAGASSSLPIEPYRVRMYDGNLLFLVTDGVLSALPEGQEEEILKSLIQGLAPGTPSEMAERLLEQVQAHGGAQDDMTVLVAGIWKR